MKRHSRIIHGLTVLLPLLLCSAAFATGKLYRYHDSEGVLVINHTLPAEYAAQGYEILDQRGRLLEVVAPPQPVPLVDANEGDEHRILSGDLEALDRMLRASYSSVEQIEAARDRRLSQIERQVDLVKATLTQTASAIGRERERAARHERAGEEVPEAIIGNLDRLRSQRDSTEHSLRIREEEFNVVGRQYAGYMERFAQLQREEN